ncbi:MAG TPA: hypothetical protein DD827_08590 [Gammaproteobacteria bacterium]|nr:hypothetical protein [Gammaproteobacteria bacterium]
MAGTIIQPQLTVPKYHTNGEITDREGLLYVERQFDVNFRALVRNHIDTSIPILHGTRQMGKTSLILSTIDELAGDGTRCCRIDLAECADQILFDGRPTTNFVMGLALLVSDQLNLLDEFDTFMDAYDVENRRLFLDARFLESFFLEVVVANLDNKTILFIDEIDRIRHFSGALEILTGFCLKVFTKSEFRKIRFVFVGLNDVRNLISDKKIKTEIYSPQHIPDFDSASPEIVEAFARGLTHIDSPAKKYELCKHVMEFTGGQPYLTNLILAESIISGANNAVQLDSLFSELSLVGKKKAEGKFSGAKIHFEQPERVLTEDYPDHRDRVFLSYGRVQESGHASKMGSLPDAAMLATGLVKRFEDRYVPRAPIYSRVFDPVWLEDIRERMIRTEAQRTKTIVRTDLPRVLLANVGGTLGMDVDANGVLVDPKDPQKFFDEMTNLTNLIRPVVQSAVSTPTDGANITPNDWVSIAKLIYRFRNKDISGAVVAMGTDTMAYAASAVAYALGQNLKFPVVFTGSQAPNNQAHADARSNLLRAALVAREGARLPEVIVAFNDEVMRAVRSEKIDDYRFKAFAAPSEGALAIIGETLQYQLQPRKIRKSTENWQLSARFEERILKVSQYPGMRPEMISSILDSGQVKGLMIESLGLGNIPVVEGYDLLPVIRQARKLNIPVLISGRYPIMPEFTQNYAPASAPLKVGAISAGDMAPPAALTKFMWAIAQVDDEIARGELLESRKRTRIKKIIQTNLLGEISRSAQVPKYRIGG